MALAGIKVIEFAGLAPGPFAGLVLADNGASVVRIDRLGSQTLDVLCRGKRSLSVDIKVPSGRELVKRLFVDADVLIDPFRPGVLERLGLGPDVFLGSGGLNKRLIYARIVGFPRQGSFRDMAGHDVNYLALSGILPLLPGTDEKPAFPLNLLADFAGGGLFCALGIILALFERSRTNLGQVVDADMVSGVRYVSSFPLLNSLLPNKNFSGPRGTNLLDGGAPFYNLYLCQGGGWISVGCLEPHFFETFLEYFLAALPPENMASWKPTPAGQFDRTDWPRLKRFMELGFLSNTRDYWTRIFQNTDACVVPVLSPVEAAKLDSPSSTSMLQSMKVSKKPAMLAAGQHTEQVLDEAGVSWEYRKQLVADGAIDAPKRAPKL
ncbi:CoA-transferase family III [Pluteus cervinus]|uniref:CoA-transferase family III n=1 Tax=Pluteus cervinus TaxID=181527 RepID=A0ACD3B4A0_9AGAR|nr:CoA-transferase family III [Pluteus cervinus]